jgi:hypothetical protein
VVHRCNAILYDMEMSRAEGAPSAHDHMKQELALQKRLACRLYETEEGNSALMLWTDDSENGPAAKFREYVEERQRKGEKINLEATSPQELDEVLRAAKIIPTVH